MESAHEKVEALLDRMRAVAGHPEVDKLSAQLSLLCRGYMEPAKDEPLPGVKLTPNEARVFSLLKARLGRAVSRGALLDAASFHHGWDSEPTNKVVDVYVCRLRRKIKGSGFVIETAWGQGYRMVAAPHASTGSA